MLASASKSIQKVKILTIPKLSRKVILMKKAKEKVRVKLRACSSKKKPKRTSHRRGFKRRRK